MLRLQTPLPDGYTGADPDELDAADRRRQGDARRSRVHPRPPLPARRGDALGRRPRRLVPARRCSPQQHPDAEYIVFCGVHFMAESADVLTGDHQQVILPDLNAGCSMADMADIDQVEEAGRRSAEVTDIERVVPITYMNSSAALKAFVGRARRRGVHVDQRPGRARVGLPARSRRRRRRHKVLFFPDQHLGRNTGFAMGYTARRHAGVEPPPRARRARPRPTSRRRRSCCGRATARCTSASGPSTSTRSAPSTPTAS